MATAARKTINLTTRGLEALHKLQDIDEHNETDTINRALQFHAAMMDYTDSEGRLTLVSDDGEHEVTVILL